MLQGWLIITSCGVAGIAGGLLLAHWFEVKYAFGTIRRLPSDRARVYPDVISKADEYRKRAEEADEIAKTARDAAARKSWADLADQWRDLARQAEKNGW